MAFHTGGSEIVFTSAAALVVVGVVWFFVTGAAWQFIPIGAIVLGGFQVAKQLNRR